MLEKLLPYIHLGINFLKDLMDIVHQILDLLVSAEESISGYKATAFD